MLAQERGRWAVAQVLILIIINEAGGRTLENIYGGGRLKAKLRKNSHSCKRVIFQKKFGYNARWSLVLLFTVKASSTSSFTKYITIILHLTNSQWVLSYCVKFKPFPRIDKKPQTSQLRVPFYHYITRSLTDIVLFCFGNGSITFVLIWLS